jgi:hypothetical protein
MENQFCYVVECSAGSYDDYHTWIAGIFSDAVDAENLKKKINTEIEIVKNTPCPFKDEEIPFLSSEQSRTFYKWYDENEKANDFNTAKVNEYPMNIEL